MPISSSAAEASTALVDAREDAPSDAVLLRKFRDRKEEAAFVQLVDRHGEMVFAVALRILRDRHAAEDVFQATFLVLARDAGRIRRPESLGAWLHGIALRMAKKSLKRRQRDRTLETVMGPLVEEPLLEEMSLLFQRQLLDEELQKLPETYREPLILHFLQGKTYEETAEVLGTSVGAIEGRLKRGKRELQLRLMRRGVGMVTVLAAISWSQSAAQAAVQPTLVSAAVQGGMAIVQGTSFAPACSSEAVHLAAKETAMFTTAKVTATVCGLLAATTLGWAVHAGLRGEGERPAPYPESINDVAVAQSQGADNSVLISQSATAGEVGAPESKASAVAAELPPDPTARNLEGPGQNAPPKVPVRTEFSPAEEKIEEELQRDVKMDFPGNPLSNVVSFLEQFHSIPIRIDSTALADAGVSEDDEVKAVVENVPLETALNLMLEDVGGVALTYVVRNGVLQITTVARADELLENRIYDIRPLGLSDPEPLVRLIELSTEGPWFFIDGVGGVMNYIGGTLVVRQTQKVHREIERLLNGLAASIQESGGRGALPEWLPEVSQGGPEGNVASGAANEAKEGMTGRVLEPVRQRGGSAPGNQSQGNGILPAAPAAVAPGPQAAVPQNIPVQTELSEQEKNIEQELQKQTSIEFPGNPLSDVMNFIEQFHRIPIRMDKTALADAGVAEDTEVSLVVSDVSLENALELLLEDVGGVRLDYVLQNDVMKITTEQRAAEVREVRVYDIRPLGLTDPARLVELIQNTTEGPWASKDEFDGPTEYVGRGSIEYVDGRLVVRQSQRGHHEVEEVLDLLLKTRSPHAAATGTVLPEWVPEPAATRPASSGSAPRAGTVPPGSSGTPATPGGKALPPGP